MMKKIDMYNLHRNHSMGRLKEMQVAEISSGPTSNTTMRIIQEEKGNLLDLDKNTFYDFNEEKKFNWTLSSTLNMYAKPAGDHYKGRKLNLDQIHLDDFYYDFDTVKIFKVDNPTLERGFPTTEKGYLYIFNRYNVNRLTRFYMDTENNYDTPMLPYFSGHIVRLGENYYSQMPKYLNLDGGKSLTMNYDEYINLGDGRTRNDLRGTIDKIGFRKFLGDTDCIVQMYVTKDRTYTRNSNGKFTTNFFESLGEVNLLYNRNQFVVDLEAGLTEVPTNERLDGKALIWGYDNQGRENSINEVLFLDEQRKYTIKRPNFVNSKPGDTSYFDMPDYSFIPTGLIFTEAGFFRDGVTSDEELKRSLREYNDLWKVKPENKRTTIKHFRGENQMEGDVTETDESDFVNYDIIKNVNDYVNLPTIPSYFYPKPTFILEGDELNKYLNHLGNLYTGNNYNLIYHEPWDTEYKRLLLETYNNSRVQNNYSRHGFIYDNNFSGRPHLRKMQDFKGFAEEVKKTKGSEYVVKTAKVSFMEAAKAGYPLKSIEAKNLFQKERRPMEWTTWTSFYYPHSDRHNFSSDSNSNTRHNITIDDIEKLIRDKYNIMTDFEEAKKKLEPLFQGNVDLNLYTDNTNNAWLSGHWNNTAVAHNFTDNVYANIYLFNTRAELLARGKELYSPQPGVDGRFGFHTDEYVTIFRSDLEQDDMWNAREIIGDFCINRIHSKEFPRMINTFDIKNYNEDVERHYTESHEILSTSHMKFKLLVNRQDSDFPRDQFGIDPRLSAYQSFTIPTSDWSDIYVDLVEYVDGYLVKYPRVLVANLPDEINTSTAIPGVELERNGNSFRLISSKDSRTNYFLEHLKSKIVNKKTLLIKKVWWR